MWKMLMWTIACMLLFIGASITASAEKIGDGYSLYGMPLMWIMIITGFIIMMIGAFGKGIPKPGPKLLVVIGIVFIVVGGLLFIDKPAEVVPVTGNIVDEWSVTTANSGTSCSWSDIDATWDDTDTPTTISAPINLDATTNALDETKFRANFTVTPSGKSGAPTDINCKIYYKTEYKMTKGGEDVLEKDGSNWIANWTNSDGDTSDYDGFLQMTLEDGTGWFHVNYELDSGNSTFGEEMDGSIGETISWKITLWDDFGWTGTYTVMVVKITDD